MAGDWIPMRMDIADDPAVIAIAASTGIAADTVVGKLHRLWSWANRHLENGYARSVTESWVDTYLNAPGFASAMLEAGWLQVRSGGIQFPNFDNWNSQSAKQRILATKRVQKMRNAPSVTKPLPEKRREERVPNGTLPAADKPPKERQPRKRDELFDAVAEVTGSDPKAAGGHVAKVANALRGADPPYTPDEVREFARRLGEFCSWAAKERRTRPELGELQKYIGRLRATRKPNAAPSDPFAATNATYAPAGMPP